MTPVVEVRGSDREFGLYVDGQLIGTSKLACDAQLLAHFLEKKFKDTLREGYLDGRESVWRRI